MIKVLKDNMQVSFCCKYLKCSFKIKFLKWNKKFNVLNVVFSMCNASIFQEPKNSVLFCFI